MAKKGPRLCAEARFGVSAGEGMRTTRRGVRRMSDLMDLDTAESDAQHKMAASRAWCYLRTLAIRVSCSANPVSSTGLCRRLIPALSRGRFGKVANNHFGGMEQL